MAGLQNAKGGPSAALFIVGAIAAGICVRDLLRQGMQATGIILLAGNALLAINFLRFMKYGVPVTIMSVAISSVYLWLLFLRGFLLLGANQRDDAIGRDLLLAIILGESYLHGR